MYTAHQIADILDAANLDARAWMANNDKVNDRAYINLESMAVRDLLGLTSSQARQITRGKFGGAYVEIAGDEVLVQGLDGRAEAAVIAALVEAGIAAR